MGSYTEIITIIGNVIFGLAIAAAVISCMLVWKLKDDVQKLTKRVKKLEREGK